MTAPDLMAKEIAEKGKRIRELEADNQRLRAELASVAYSIRDLIRDVEEVLEVPRELRVG